jgi:rubrerythrin
MDRTEHFDLDRYLRASKKVDLAGVRWDEIKAHPLSPDEARTIAYMMDIESHTVIYLRDLLATKAAFEPDVTAFLSCWVYEELWHGEAFSRFLGEAGYPLPPDDEHVWGAAPYPSRQARNSWIRRMAGAKGYAGHIGTLIGSFLFSDFVALHMTWGAVNELSTLTGYHLIIDRTRHPILIDLLRRIVKDERRHFAFYRAQARMRLARSAQARRVTRWAMEHVWAPVGTGVRPQRETDFVVAYLFGDETGIAKAREMDVLIGELPGFRGTRLYSRALREAVRRLAKAGEASRAAAPMAAFRA